MEREWEECPRIRANFGALPNSHTVSMMICSRVNFRKGKENRTDGSLLPTSTQSGNVSGFFSGLSGLDRAFNPVKND
jgi:hypothetical protein